MEFSYRRYSRQISWQTQLNPWLYCKAYNLEVSTVTACYDIGPLHFSVISNQKLHNTVLENVLTYRAYQTVKM